MTRTRDLIFLVLIAASILACDKHQHDHEPATAPAVTADAPRTSPASAPADDKVEYEAAYPADVDETELAPDDVQQQEKAHSEDPHSHSDDDAPHSHGNKTGGHGH